VSVSPSSLLGAAGEHYVMSQLLRRGFIAALARVGVPTATLGAREPRPVWNFP
jgi:hypothetical protein